MQIVCARAVLPGGIWQIDCFVPLRPHGEAAHPGRVVVVRVLVVVVVLLEVVVVIVELIVVVGVMIATVTKMPSTRA